MAARSKTYDCGRSSAEIVGSNSRNIITVIKISLFQLIISRCLLRRFSNNFISNKFWLGALEKRLHVRGRMIWEDKQNPTYFQYSGLLRCEIDMLLFHGFVLSRFANSRLYSRYKKVRHQWTSASVYSDDWNTSSHRTARCWKRWKEALHITVFLQIKKKLTKNTVHCLEWGF